MDWVPDLRQLRAFVAVVEEGSFTLAARRIFVTQSAVSHSLRTLEEQLSCRLLDRTGKRVAVTAEGELLLVGDGGQAEVADALEADTQELGRV